MTFKVCHNAGTDDNGLLAALNGGNFQLTFNSIHCAGRSKTGYTVCLGF